MPTVTPYVYNARYEKEGAINTLGYQMQFAKKKLGLRQNKNQRRECNWSEA